MLYIFGIRIEIQNFNIELSGGDQDNGQVSVSRNKTGKSCLM